MQALIKAWQAANQLHDLISGYEASQWQQAQQSNPTNLCLRSNANPSALIAQIATIRAALSKALRQMALTKTNVTALAEMELIHITSGRLRGMMFAHPLAKAEAKALQADLAVFCGNWDKLAACFRAFTSLAYYYQPFDVPLQTNIATLPPLMLKRYLYFIMRQPHIMQCSDELAYLRYYEELTAWLLQLLHSTQSPLDKQQQAMVLRIMTSTLTFGTCYYLDQPITSIIKARAKLLRCIQQHTPEHRLVKAFKPNTPPTPNRSKIRLGIISRNIGDYTDTRALFGMFAGFDAERYELYWYSLDILDPTTGHDVAFYRQLYSRIHKLTGLRHSPARNAQQILSDDLDMMVVGSAYSFGVKPYDQLVAYRLARVQIGFNPMVPSSSGLASYDDYIVTAPADARAETNYRAEITEQPRFMADPLVWYHSRPATPPNPAITRHTLGIPKNAIVYFSGAAANKQMPATMQCWLEILQNVPNSVLMLMPFNPAWGGYYIGLTFLNRLQQMLKHYPQINANRIVVVREVTPTEGNQILQLADIYLGSFPHAGATSTMLALRHNVPVVARRSQWLRSTSDASLVTSIGLEECIGADNAEFIAIATRLGTEHKWREQVKAHIANHIDTAPFFNPTACTQKLQTIFDTIASERGLL